MIRTPQQQQIDPIFKNGRANVDTKFTNVYENRTNVTRGESPPASKAGEIWRQAPEHLLGGPGLQIIPNRYDC